MRARLLIVLAVMSVLAAACDRSDAPPPPPTVPQTLPPEPETEQCADLVDTALGLLQGQLDALAGIGARGLLEPEGTLPPTPALDALADELADRSAELCTAGELGSLLAPRLAELQPSGTAAERYVELLAARLTE